MEIISKVLFKKIESKTISLWVSCLSAILVVFIFANSNLQAAEVTKHLKTKIASTAQTELIQVNISFKENVDQEEVMGSALEMGNRFPRNLNN